MYTTDMSTFVEIGGEVLAGAFGDQGPTATAVGVTALFHPQQMFEVTAVAVAP